MKVLPLAADSLGARSMATYVEVGDLRLLIDPGATLAPSRFGLPPSEAEWEALRRANDRISAYAARANTIFVSHYHDDHFRSDPATYTGRRVLVKDPRRMIAGLQARRGMELWQVLAATARVARADALVERDGEVELRVSPPLPHGLEGTTFGYVLAVTVVDHAERERFVFASDVQGPLSAVAGAWLAQQRPTLVYLSGPPTYLEHDLGAAAIDRAIAGLLRLVERAGCRVILDHHAVRDPRWEARLAPLFETGRVMTAAGFLGIPDASLERQRRELWQDIRKPATAVRGRSTRADSRDRTDRTGPGARAARAAQGAMMRRTPRTLSRGRSLP